MIAADSTMDTSAPWSALPITRHHRDVKRAFRSIHDGFSAVDDAGFVRRRTIPLAQRVLAQFGNALHEICHGGYPFGLHGRFLNDATEAGFCIEAPVLPAAAFWTE